MDEVNVKINIGDTRRDYRIGDYINAIDELTCHFSNGDCEYAEHKYADALEMYAKSLRGE